MEPVDPRPLVSVHGNTNPEWKPAREGYYKYSRSFNRLRSAFLLFSLHPYRNRETQPKTWPSPPSIWDIPHPELALTTITATTTTNKHNQ